MAVSIRIWGVAKDGATRFSIDPVYWWNTDVCKDKRFTRTNDTGSYDDFDADLSIEEFKVLHERYKKEDARGTWKDEIAILDKAVYEEADQYSHIHVCVYEWDSGM